MFGHSVLDHLVIAAADLPSGREWTEQRLGLDMQPGGEHVHFGTHNALLSLQGDSLSPGLGGYLEVIAVNPAASALAYPRWFGLDTPEMQRRLAAGPALIHWVVSVPDLAAALRLSPEDHGEALALSRGPNRWKLSVSKDGSLPMQGVLPSLIEWQTPSPASRLPDSGLRLKKLTLTTPQPERLQAVLNTLGLSDDRLEIKIGPHRLEAALKLNGRTFEL
jgi:Glyoxalase-like domain